jgi:hypothetical protein
VEVSRNIEEDRTNRISDNAGNEKSSEVVRGSSLSITDILLRLVC